MKNTFLKILPLFLLTSCNHGKRNEIHSTEIGRITYEAQINYLKNRIQGYSYLSKKGLAFKIEDSIFSNQIRKSKDELEKKGNISTATQDSLFAYFLLAFTKESGLLSEDRILKLRNQEIKSFADINQLDLIYKMNILSKIDGASHLPFDTWGTMATVDKWEIKNGENFKMQMNITATNSEDPAVWYILKDGSQELTKSNVIDTLYPGEFGEINYQTKNYHIGTNQIIVATKIQTARGEQIVERSVEFTVE